MKLIWLLFLVSCAASGRKKRPKRPNIVMIVADDMGYQDVGFRGSNILTPNIDELAKKGVILENHYTMPECSPTRSSLMSGRHALRTGFWKGNVAPREAWGLRLNETTLPEMLKRNGYATHGIGKWHCGMYTWQHTPAQRGFDKFFGLFLGAQNYFTHERSNKIDFREDFYNADGEFVDNIRDDLRGQYNTDLFTDRACETIEEHDKNKPLFLFLSYTAPHNPYQAPKEAVEKFASHIPGPKNRRLYATQISIMDAGIGKVVASLKENNMIENTIILFFSDNGSVFSRTGVTGSNYPLRGAKHVLFEGGVRTVALVNSPLIQKKGYTNKNLHHVTDWYATFQKLAGDRPATHNKPQLPIDGVDIWKSINKNKPCRDEVLVNYQDHSMIQDSSDHEFLVKREEDYDEGDNFDETRDHFVIRWKNWKLFSGTYKVLGWTAKNSLDKPSVELKDNESLPYVGKGSQSGINLFDLSTDPREMNNVADKHPDVVKDILAKIPGYKKKMTKINERSSSSAATKNGVWTPWVLKI